MECMVVGGVWFVGTMLTAATSEDITGIIYNSFFIPVSALTVGAIGGHGGGA